MKRILLASITAAALSLGACSSVPVPGVYKIDIQQGNYLDPEQIAKLEIGMSRDQVRFVMGPPMLTDTFHADRWDYLYLYQPGDGEARREHLVLTFADNRLAAVDGSVDRPTLEAGSATATQDADAQTGLLTRFWNWVRRR